MACNQSPGSSMIEKCIVVAVASDMAIGRDNSLLWHISEDLKMFRRLTMGSPVIMGRKTFLSIGRPLPGRTNIVLSRSFKDAPEGVLVVNSLEEAYAACGDAPRCFVIGGGQIYREAIADADVLYVTEVHASFEADTYFPEIDPGIWEACERSGAATDEKSGYEYEFVTYRRK